MKNRILKFTLVPICCVIVACGIALTKPSENSNTIIKVAENEQKSIHNISNPNKEKHIFEVSIAEVNWISDPSDPKNVMRFGSNTSVVKIKVNSFEEPAFTFPNDITTPYTPINVTVEQVLYGKETIGVKTIYLAGGEVTISDVMATMDESSMDKRRYDTLTQEEQDNMYIAYKTFYDYALEIDKKYVVILGDNIIVANGYGIFVENDSNSNSYKNVITGNKLELLAITPSNLEYKQKNDLKIKDIITKDESNDKYDYNVKSYGGDVYITIQGEKIELREALLQDKINMNDIIDGAKKDTQNGAIKSEIYKDGGSTIYKYKDYAILKCNRLDGNKDVYIGMPTMDINDILF